MMEKFWEFVKKTWGLVLVLFFAPVIVIIVFVVLEYCFHKINMSAGEWSQLLGSAFSYWGTVILGLLAFWQNDQLREENNILFEYEKNKMIPIFAIENVGYRGVLQDLCMCIKNYSDNMACEFSISSIRIYKSYEENESSKIGTFCLKSQDKYDFLGAHEQVNIVFDTPQISIDKDSVLTYLFSVYATNIVGISKTTEMKIVFNSDLRSSCSYNVIDT